MIGAADMADLDRWLRAHAGLRLQPDKVYFAESRLSRLARDLGLDSIDALMIRLRTAPSPALMDRLAEAMTVNETSFFRDGVPFRQFQEVMMPAFDAVRPPGRPIRIWCAGASTGQEPYSLRMALLSDASLAARRPVNILATDLSAQALERARKGVYSTFEIQRGVPVRMVVRHFRRIGSHWQIHADVAAGVVFRRLNLLDSFEELGVFDMIFCRNVLLYLDEAVRRDVLIRLSRQLAPDGFLVLGGTEQACPAGTLIERVEGERGLFRPRRKARAA